MGDQRFDKYSKHNGDGVYPFHNLQGNFAPNANVRNPQVSITALTVTSPGTGVVQGTHFAPTIAKGTTVTAGTFTYVGTAVNSPITVASNGTGCTAGTYSIYGTSGTVQNVSVGHSGFWTASITVAAGGAVTVNSLTSGGQYAVNPTSPDIGNGVTGCSGGNAPTFNLAMGAAYAKPLPQQAGVYSNFGALTQPVTDAGTGAVFTATFAPIASYVSPPSQAAGAGPGGSIFDAYCNAWNEACV